MSIDPTIFRAYDIRGAAHEQLTADACERIGKGFGSTLREMYGDRPRVVVGRDARTHSPEFAAALVQGLTSTGCQVYDIGQTPSPVNYFTICHDEMDGGVQVTASHNPAEDNGLKLQTRHAEAYAGDNLQRLRRRIESDDFLTGDGAVQEYDAVTPYTNFLTEMFADVGNGMQIAVDSGNGVAGPVYTDVLESVGCTVHGLYLEPDGTFPNHPADPSKYETLEDLQTAVRQNNAHLGLGYDGDGDRVGLVDENGDIRTADEVLLLLARDHLQRNNGKAVVFTVSNSGALESEITRWGGQPVLCQVGHSFVEHAMREHGALLGGEQSGHFFCGENYYGFDDALMASLRLLKILRESGTSLSALCADFPTVYQMPEYRPYCRDDAKGDVIAAVTEHFRQEYPVETMDGARIDFGDGAWAGIRQSNTSPRLSVCIEARTPEKLQAVQEEVLNHLREYEAVEG